MRYTLQQKKTLRWDPFFPCFISTNRGSVYLDSVHDVILLALIWSVSKMIFTMGFKPSTRWQIKHLDILWTLSRRNRLQFSSSPARFCPGGEGGLECPRIALGGGGFCLKVCFNLNLKLLTVYLRAWRYITRSSGCGSRYLETHFYADDLGAGNPPDWALIAVSIQSAALGSFEGLRIRICRWKVVWRSTSQVVGWQLFRSKCRALLFPQPGVSTVHLRWTRWS